MGVVRRLEDHRAALAASRACPHALRVVVDTGDPADAALGVVVVSVRVLGAHPPVRLYLYVDGHLVAAWTETDATHELRAEDYELGRHRVTARAVDALGRWGGASLVVACSVPDDRHGRRADATSDTRSARPWS